MNNEFNMAARANAQAVPQNGPMPAVQGSLSSAAQAADGLIARLHSPSGDLSSVLRPLPPPSAASPKASLQAIAESPLHEQVIALRVQVDEAVDLVESIRARLTV